MPKKIGATFDWRGASAEGIAELARTADGLNYDSFWIPEAWGTDGFAVCAYVLSQTKQIRVRTGILNVYSRSAALIGMGCLTLLQIAPERFSLGLGTSGRALVEDWHGVKFDKPLQRTREYVKVIRKVVRGEIVDFNGEVLRLRRFRAYTQIPQTQSFRIYLAALGDKSLRLAGEISDGAIVIFYSMRRLEHALEELSSGGGEKELVAMIPAEVITEKQNVEKSLLSLKKRIAFYISSMGEYYAKILSDSGFSKTVERVREAYRQGDREKAVGAVSKEVVDELCLLGSATEIQRKLDTFPERITPVLGMRISTTEEIAESKKALELLAKT